MGGAAATGINWHLDHKSTKKKNKNCVISAPPHAARTGSQVTKKDRWYGLTSKGGVGTTKEGSAFLALGSKTVQKVVKL